MNYYNEFDPFAAEWLRELIKEKLIPEGIVDERSITEVDPRDVREFTQCHWFAGIAGWSLALELAGWKPDRPVWTGSPPCQPFSVAGKRKGKDDERHLWPVFFNLVRECRPPVIFGEQVASAIRVGWFDDLQNDLEKEEYAGGMVVLPASSVGAPHKRDRLFYFAERLSDSPILGRDPRSGSESGRERESSRQERDELREDARNGCESNCFYCGYSFDQERLGYYGCPNCLGGVDDAERGEFVDDAEYSRLEGYGRTNDGTRSRTDPDRSSPETSLPAHWSDVYYPKFGDGKRRPVPIEPALFPLANGISNRVGILRGAGNAIVPQVGAEVIRAFMERDQ